MTFRHVVLYRWRDHVDAELLRRIAEAHDRLATRLDDLVGFVHGGDVGLSADGFDYHVVAEFRTIDGWRAYRDHPERLVLEAELLEDAVAERAGGQFTSGPRRTAGEEGASDDEILAAARQLAAERMAALLAEPDDVT
ncbi:MAG: Dabb family protein [Ilumatobacteraceae bacterium]